MTLYKVHSNHACSSFWEADNGDQINYDITIPSIYTIHHDYDRNKYDDE